MTAQMMILGARNTLAVAAKMNESTRLGTISHASISSCGTSLTFHDPALFLCSRLL